MQQNPADMSEVARLFRACGFEVKEGKYLSVRGKGQKNYIRLRSLRSGYTEQDILHKMESRRHRGGRQKEQKTFEMLIDIQAKLNAGKGRGYERWAKSFNVKQMARALLFLQENGVKDYDDLVQKADEFERLSTAIKEKASRLQEIATLKKHIFNHSRTRKVYEEYRKSGYSKTFMEEHREEITLHKAAKVAFDALSVKKLPKIKDLNNEYAVILAEKKRLYAGYREARKRMQEFALARKNVETILEIDPEKKAPEMTKQR